MALQTATDVHADITISNTLLSDDKNDYYSAIAFLTQAWDGIFNESIKLIIPNDLPIEFTPTELKISACIKLLSIISVRIVERIIDKLIVLSDVNPKEVILSITGGFALNCPINTFLMNKYRFKGFQSPPCVNDAGISMGGHC
ncbi:hypothetical protein [Pectobacterium sp. B2J-2]|uniref:hypothetical protein n=1 Tax=Pectobacterium sp. B2J-2 TaxID=3385372 RepID=UPI0038FC4F53